MSTLRSLLSFSAVCVASLLNTSVSNGQSVDPAAEPIADHERAAIVWDVLSDEFDRVEAPTQVRLSMAGLNVAWIPTLPNVDFVLLSEEAVAEANEACEPYVFFDSFERSRRRITVAFGSGTRCSSSGHIYAFRYRQGKLRLDGRGFGGFARGASHCKCR